MTPTALQRLEERLEGARKKTNAAIQTLHYTGGYSYLDSQSCALARTAGLGVLRDMFGTSHQNYIDFEDLTRRNGPSSFKRAEAILSVVGEELRNGWFDSMRSLLAADVFSDFLEMAEHLSSEGYKDAAAVIAGSSLEAHLRRLAEHAGVALTNINTSGQTVHKKAETINQELAKASAYDKNEQKQVTAWLGVRNDAAHGNYQAVVAEVVAQMVAGVRWFISRHPA